MTGAFGGLSASCDTPPSIDFKIYTDMPCSRLAGLRIFSTSAKVGWQPRHTLVSDVCTDKGELGSIVAVSGTPLGEEFEAVATLGVGRRAESCPPLAYAPGCITQRVRTRFLESHAGGVNIHLVGACLGVKCGPDATCVSGRCMPAAQSVRSCGLRKPCSVEERESLLSETCVDTRCSVDARLALGGEHTCAVVPGRGVRCFGANGEGQAMPQDPRERRTEPSLWSRPGVQRSWGSLGWRCVDTQSLGLACWGENSQGQQPNFAGRTLREPGLLPGIARVAAVALALDHGCAASALGQLYCWGANLEGQTGAAKASTAPPALVPNLGHVVNVATPTGSSCALNAALELSCWGSNDFGQLGRGNQVGYEGPQLVKLPLPAVDLKAGESHLCALHADGSVSCWGDNRKGQSADTIGKNVSGPHIVRGLPPLEEIALGGDLSCGRTGEGAVWCWGDNSSEALGSPSDALAHPEPRKLSLPAAATAQLAVGSGHICLQTQAGEVFCWGKNNQGQADPTSMLPTVAPSQAARISWPVAAQN